MPWRKDIFDNFIKLNRGFDLPEKDIIPGDYPVVASTSIKARHNTYKVKPPCVVTGRSGSLGTVQYVEMPCWPLNTTLYVKDFKENHPRYVSYCLQTMRLENFNSGAGVPTLNRNHLHKLRIDIPTLPLQGKIAAILSAYDDLIEINNRRIALLEKMAEELYREWFVRLRFPAHEKVKIIKGVPDGWTVKELKDVAAESSRSTKPGGHLSDRYYLPIDLLQSKRFMPTGHLPYTDAQSSLVLFERGDILFGAMRPYLHKVALAPFSGITRTTCFVLRPIDHNYYSWLYLLLFQVTSVEYASLICNGVDRPYVVWNRGFEKMQVLMPPKTLAASFHHVIHPVLEYIQQRYFVIQNLTKTRYQLLSRLMSGKINVENMDIEFPASMKQEAVVA